MQAVLSGVCMVSRSSLQQTQGRPTLGHTTWLGHFWFTLSGSVPDSPGTRDKDLGQSRAMWVILLKGKDFLNEIMCFHPGTWAGSRDVGCPCGTWELWRNPCCEPCSFAVICVPSGWYQVHQLPCTTHMVAWRLALLVKGTSAEVACLGARCRTYT